MKRAAWSILPHVVLVANSCYLVLAQALYRKRPAIRPADLSYSVLFQHAPFLLVSVGLLENYAHNDQDDHHSDRGVNQ
jgi:hypothetical protein